MTRFCDALTHLDERFKVGPILRMYPIQKPFTIERVVLKTNLAQESTVGSDEPARLGFPKEHRLF